MTEVEELGRAKRKANHKFLSKPVKLGQFLAKWGPKRPIFGQRRPKMPILEVEICGWPQMIEVERQRGKKIITYRYITHSLFS